MPFPRTSTSLLLGVQAFRNSSPIFRVSKLKCPCSYYETDSLEALDFLCLLVVRTDSTPLATREFSSSPLAWRFLAPWNLTRPLPQSQVVNQVKFLDLACTSMTLHDFMSWPGPCREHTGDFFFLVFFLSASSSEGFEEWFDPFLYVNLADWWFSPDCLIFLFWIFPLHCVWNIYSAVFLRGLCHSRK